MSIIKVLHLLLLFILTETACSQSEYPNVFYLHIKYKKNKIFNVFIFF